MSLAGHLDNCPCPPCVAAPLRKQRAYELALADKIVRELSEAQRERQKNETAESRQLLRIIHRSNPKNRREDALTDAEPKRKKKGRRDSSGTRRPSTSGGSRQ